MKGLSAQGINERVFLAGVVAYMAVLVVSGLNLHPASVAFPYVVMGCCALALVMKLLTFISPRMRFLDPSGEWVQSGKPRDNKPAAPAEHQKGDYRALIYLGALAAFPVLVFLIGFLPTLVLWLSAFLIVLSRVRLLSAVMATACMLLAVYVVFVVVLNVRFPSGVLLRAFGG
ncbi:MAG: hypothetical protein HPY55_04480 [Firmicutes bacterium]|nr:hypothetical protein [Bacillota bacterium]